MTSLMPGTDCLMTRSTPCFIVIWDIGQPPQAPLSWTFTTPSSTLMSWMSPPSLASAGRIRVNAFSTSSFMAIPPNYYLLLTSYLLDLLQFHDPVFWSLLLVLPLVVALVLRLELIMQWFRVVVVDDAERLPGLQRIPLLENSLMPVPHRYLSQVQVDYCCFHFFLSFS